MNLTTVSALALDIDGTILDPAHRIRPVVRDAIVRIAGTGVAVILASARFPGAIREIQAELGLAGQLLVACQGAVGGRYRGDAFEVIHEVPISPDDTRAVLALAAAGSMPVSRFGAETWHVEAGNPMVAQEVDIVGCEPTVVADLAAVRLRAAKFTFTAPAGREIELASLTDALPLTVRGSISRPDYLEIVDAAVSKATALTAVLDHLGIDRTSLAAAGDGANDAEMLQLARVSIAMGHAPAQLRQIATWTVGTNAEDGLAEGIDRLLALEAVT